MKINLRKLPKKQAAELEAFPVESAEPYRPLPAPVYVLLSKNEKLVSIKGPFDFLTPRELERMRSSGEYYYGPILRKAAPFVEAAGEIRKMLEWNQPSATKVLEPSPFEISDAVLRKMASLWAVLPKDEGSEEEQKIGVESYFAVVFANALCEPIPGDRMDQARERDPDLYETAILRSGVFVFLALHLGYLDLKRLSDLRYRFFSELIQVTAFGDFTPLSMELADLKRWTETLIHSPEVHLLSSEMFEYSISRVSQKLKSRLERVRRDLVDPSIPLQSVEDGGRNVG